MLFGGLVALVFADAIAGRRAAMAENRGVHPGQARQFARGFVMVACAAAAGAVFATAAATPRWLEAREWRRIETRCTPTTLSVTNGDRKGRMVTVSAVAIRTMTFPGRGTDYSVPPEGSTRIELPAGTSRDIGFVVPDEIRDVCLTSSCALVFSLEMIELEAGSSLLKGEGACVPYWDQPQAAWTGRIEPATVAAE